MVGSVEKYFRKRIRAEGAIHLTLIDPEEVSVASAWSLAKKLAESETAAVMVGGSTTNSTVHLDNVVKTIKREVQIPVILFPNNVTGISKHADAIWFMSLLNSVDPYFLVGVQILGAPLVKKHGLEALPLGYIIVGEGGAAGIVGRAIPIPYTKPELTVAHALAAQYLGMRFVYLEAGSGARQPVPPAMIRAVRDVVDTILIVGGGIRDSEQAKAVVKAGADIVVTGNIIEEAGTKREFVNLLEAIRQSGATKRQRIARPQNCLDKVLLTKPLI